MGGVMTEVDLAPRRQRPLGSAGSTVQPPLTLAEEHVLLLWQVTARAEELMAAIADGGWPGVELAALAGYAQAEVLRQASDEEALLFSTAPAREVAGLARDHARLRSAADLLARVAAGEQPMSPAQVATAARDFVTQLEHHLQSEQNLLASRSGAKGVPATVTRGGHRHEWYPLTEGPVVDLGALPEDQAVAAAVDRLLRMRRGEQVELRSGVDLELVWREISELIPVGYQFTAVQDGPPLWRMQVTRRQAS
jgi:uncharacterized protein (DUF2249 family)